MTRLLLAIIGAFFIAFYAHAQTVSGSQAHPFTSAPVVACGQFFNDIGCLGANPNSDFQNTGFLVPSTLTTPGSFGYAAMDGQPTILNTYAGPDNIAGASYPVGEDKALAAINLDPTTFLGWAALGCSYSLTGSALSGPGVSCVNNANINITIAGFSWKAQAGHDCVQLYFRGSADSGNHVVRNNDFSVGTFAGTSQCSNTAGWDWIRDDSTTAVDDFEYNDFDGGWYSLAGRGTAFWINNVTAFGTIKYNRFSNFGSRFGQTKGGSGWVIDYNYYQDQSLSTDHGEIIDFGGAYNVTVSSIEIQGNTIVQTNNFSLDTFETATTSGSTITGCPSCVLTVGTLTGSPILTANIGLGIQVVGAGTSYTCAITSNISGGSGSGSIWNIGGAGCVNVSSGRIDVGVLTDITSSIWLTDNNPVLTVTGDVTIAHNTVVYNASKAFNGAYYPVGGYAMFGIGQGFRIKGNLNVHDNREDPSGMFVCQQNNAVANNATASVSGSTVTLTVVGASSPWYPGALVTNSNAGLGFVNQKLLDFGTIDPNTGLASTCTLTGLTMNAPCTMVLSGGSQTISSNSTWVLYPGFTAIVESNNVNLKDGSAITTGFSAAAPGPYGMNSGAGYHCNGANTVH